jgi:hypothetical protein
MPHRASEKPDIPMHSAAVMHLFTFLYRFLLTRPGQLVKYAYETEIIVYRKAKSRLLQ